MARQSVSVILRVLPTQKGALVNRATIAGGSWVLSSIGTQETTVNVLVGIYIPLLKK
jgi:hypothetical protein